jgi:hypothetical protein
LRLFAELPVKLRVAVRIHAALKCLRGDGPIKKLRGDAQSTDAECLRMSHAPDRKYIGSPSAHLAQQRGTR